MDKIVERWQIFNTFFKRSNVTNKNLPCTQKGFASKPVHSTNFGGNLGQERTLGITEIGTNSFVTVYCTAPNIPFDTSTRIAILEPKNSDTQPPSESNPFVVLRTLLAYPPPPQERPYFMDGPLQYSGGSETHLSEHQGESIFLDPKSNLTGVRLYQNDPLRLYTPYFSPILQLLRQVTVFKIH